MAPQYDDKQKHHNLSPLYDNPFKLSKCRKALSEKYGVDEAELIKQMSSCKQFSGVLTRENWQRVIDAKDKNERFCPYDQRSAIRSHKMKIDQIMNKNVKKNNESLPSFVEHYPVYFMIAKSASSSISNLLKEYNEYFGYSAYGSIDHKIAIHANIKSECSFTFVRDPITRFIAGYYTINALLYLLLKEKFSNIQNETFLRFELPFDQRKRHKNVRFAMVRGEPQRFKAFLNEMVSNPFRFTRLWQIDHIQSQTEILSVYFGNCMQSKLHFVGKVEQFSPHWKELTNLCSFFQNKSDLAEDQSNRKNDKFQWNLNPKAWHKEYDRFEEFIQYLSLDKVYEHYVERGNLDNVLPPIWYHIDERIYDQIVEYYLMDYQCFGYEPNYKEFVRERDKFMNIYDSK